MIFRFSNFAVSGLAVELLQGQTYLQFRPEDVVYFPVLADGEAFPITLSDREGAVEIVYAVSLNSAGVCSILRGREGTAEQNWAVGTAVQHTFTAATLNSVGQSLLPRGEYDPTLSYQIRDMVTLGGVSYIAKSASQGQIPPGAAWQSLYDPNLAGGENAVFRGAYSSATRYQRGALVLHRGYLWSAKNVTLGEEPSRTGASWAIVATGGEYGVGRDALTATGTNNYFVAEDLNPRGGITVRLALANANTGICTLRFNSGAALPLRPSKIAEFSSGDLNANSLYDFTFVESANAWVQVGAGLGQYAARAGTTFTGFVSVPSFRSEGSTQIGNYTTTDGGIAQLQLGDGNFLGYNATSGWFFNSGTSNNLTINGQTIYTTLNLNPAQMGADVTFKYIHVVPDNPAQVPAVELVGASRKAVIAVAANGSLTIERRLASGGSLGYYIQVDADGNVVTDDMGNVKNFIDARDQYYKTLAVAAAVDAAKSLFIAEARWVDAGSLTALSPAAPGSAVIYKIQKATGDDLTIWSRYLQVKAPNLGWVTPA